MVLSRLVSGVRAPRQRILGSELAGVVEQAGSAVSEFKVGDRVFGLTGIGFGAHAEYRCMREIGRIAHIPEAMTFQQAAPMCDGALNALWCLRLADLEKRQKVLIYGASGAIGSAGVQLARHFKTDVTAVCATKNLELMKSIGAGRVIDYTKEDFTKTGETYDVIFDAVGKQTFARCRSSLKPGGAYLIIVLLSRGLFALHWASLRFALIAGGTPALPASWREVHTPQQVCEPRV